MRRCHFSPTRYSRDLSLEPQPAPYVYKLGFDLVGDIEANPDEYLLLQQEAKQRGIEVSADEVGTVLANELYTSNYQKVSPDTVGEEPYGKLGSALTRFLPVLTLVRQVEANVKVTKPMWDQTMARLQLVRLAIVEIPAGRFTATVGFPTPEQIQAQYDQYRDVVPQPKGADVTGMNFGYKIPDRVRVQYLTIPRKSVLEAVRTSRPAYDWKVDAIFYYNAHKSDYVGLAPETQPTTKPTTSPTTSTAGATTAPTTATATTTPSTEPATPTTRPFAEVQERVMTTILAAPADELAKKIQAAITTRLRADYTTSAPSATSQPTTVPSAGFASKAYLDGVALDIQKQFNVLPEVTQAGDWLDLAGLAKLPGIGSASSENAAFASSAIPSTQPAPSGSSPASLALLQPSEPMNDPNSNIYVFRIVQRDAAHTPPLKEIAVNVAADVQSLHTYQAALGAAKVLLEASRKHRLPDAAALQNLPVIRTPTPFAPGSPIPGYTASPEASRMLGTKARDLLQEASAEDPRPVEIVELPADKKVLVVQLTDVASRIKPDDMYFIQLVRTRQEDAAARENIARQYFSFDALKSRLDYTPITADSGKSGS